MLNLSCLIILLINSQNTAYYIYSKICNNMSYSMYIGPGTFINCYDFIVDFPSPNLAKDLITYFDDLTSKIAVYYMAVHYIQFIV